MTISRERTTSAQFALRDGQQADDCPQLLSAEIAGLAAADPRDALHIICEPVEPTPRAAHIVVAMMAAIRDAYAESDRGDPIAAIAAAVEAANDVLYTKNRAGAPNLRVFLGVTCLVIRDRDLAICQVPPTQAIVAQNGTPIALPELVSWRGDYQPRAGDPYLGHEGPHGLGMHAEALPLLFRASLEPGDLITLCSSNLAALLADEELAPLVGDDPAAA